MRAYLNFAILAALFVTALWWFATTPVVPR
jgi:hypothetical protein